ncbi:hypothetical protein VNO78_33095 [Psophocarpus tetragonolobus]|uniref:CCHC-type domain-containing protein n=1 Tax=Psophocarpus tetragonolobus TaxID=3891 RepID=A0AAN9NWQ8_PSOTE
MTYDIKGYRYGHMTTNLSECVNKVLKDCRNIPISALVRRFQVFHYPCSHVIAVCGAISLDYYQFVDQLYTNDFIMRAYFGQWFPLGNDDLIPHNKESWTLIPNYSAVRGKGRPKSTRIRNEMDFTESQTHRKNKCRRCGQEGHNRRNCPLPDVGCSQPTDVDM